jgi:hypothetical protein
MRALFPSSRDLRWLMVVAPGLPRKLVAVFCATMFIGTGPLLAAPPSRPPHRRRWWSIRSTSAKQPQAGLSIRAGSKHRRPGFRWRSPSLFEPTTGVHQFGRGSLPPPCARTNPKGNTSVKSAARPTLIDLRSMAKSL